MSQSLLFQVYEIISGILIGKITEEGREELRQREACCKCPQKSFKCFLKLFEPRTKETRDDLVSQCSLFYTCLYICWYVGFILFCYFVDFSLCIEVALFLHTISILLCTSFK